MMGNSNTLLRLVENHLAHGVYREGDLPDDDFAVVAGSVPISREGDQVRFGSATIVAPDIEASNGVIHAIDAVVTEVCVVITLDEQPTCRDLTRPD